MATIVTVRIGAEAESVDMSIETLADIKEMIAGEVAAVEGGNTDHTSAEYEVHQDGKLVHEANGFR
tara:strand:+ start:1895 stop:2092 length:198 start_codon:yes stop_codon:yes gene_type:complete